MPLATPSTPSSPALRRCEGWTDQLIEMAEHIGADPTLKLIELFGGQSVYIARRPSRPSIEEAIGRAAAEKLRRIYTCEKITLPAARYLLARRRRAVIVAKARAGMISVAEAARMIGTSRTYMSHLVHHTSEGA